MRGISNAIGNVDLERTVTNKYRYYKKIRPYGLKSDHIM